MTRPVSINGAIALTTPPRGIRTTFHRGRSGPGTFTCREDFDLVGRVIAEKRRRSARRIGRGW